MICDAVMSACGRYRYSLTRRWDDYTPTALFVGLNPSKADARKNDPTVVRLINFAKRWGCGEIQIVNMFAFRATSPDELFKCETPGHAIGLLNDSHLLRTLADVNDACGRIVVCWGQHDMAFTRLEAMHDFFCRIGAEPWCFGKTKYGMPKHPVRLGYDTKLEPYHWEPLTRLPWEN